MMTCWMRLITRMPAAPKAHRCSLGRHGIVPPYVGMVRKQNGGYNVSISVQMLIFHQVVNSHVCKTVRSALCTATAKCVLRYSTENDAVDCYKVTRLHYNENLAVCNV